MYEELQLVSELHEEYEVTLEAKFEDIESDAYDRCIDETVVVTPPIS